jgi:hypothetical protein
METGGGADWALAELERAGVPILSGVSGDEKALV